MVGRRKQTFNTEESKFIIQFFKSSMNKGKLSKIPFYFFKQFKRKCCYSSLFKHFNENTQVLVGKESIKVNKAKISKRMINKRYYAKNTLLISRNIEKRYYKIKHKKFNTLKFYWKHKRLFKKSSIINYEKVYQVPSLLCLKRRFVSKKEGMNKIEIKSIPRQALCLNKV
jgi:hypothetical protein